MVSSTGTSTSDTDTSLTSFYENMEFFSNTGAEGPLVWGEEDAEEDDDSSKWTLSAHNTDNSRESVGTKKSVGGSGSGRTIQRPSSVPPPVPSFPPSSTSESSSDDSFNSCASNPEQLAAMGDSPAKEKVKPLNAVCWGHVVKVISEGEDVTEAPTDELHSEDEAEGDILGAMESDVQSVTTVEKVEGPIVPCEERPETGPGDEFPYQNIQVTQGTLVLSPTSSASSQGPGKSL